MNRETKAFVAIVVVVSVATGVQTFATLRAERNRKEAWMARIQEISGQLDEIRSRGETPSPELVEQARFWLQIMDSYGL